MGFEAGLTAHPVGKILPILEEKETTASNHPRQQC